VVQAAINVLFDHAHSVADCHIVSFLSLTLAIYVALGCRRGLQATCVSSPCSVNKNTSLTVTNNLYCMLPSLYDLHMFLR
jgi:hypothetical protein